MSSSALTSRHSLHRKGQGCRSRCGQRAACSRNVACRCRARASLLVRKKKVVDFRVDFSFFRSGGGEPVFINTSCVYPPAYSAQRCVRGFV